MYRPPEWETVGRKLFNEVMGFLQECGGPYKEIEGYVQEHVISCLATGQFLYSKDRYFVCWWLVTKEGLKDIENHLRPDVLTNGEIMYIPECGVKEGMTELIRRIRKKGNKGVHWHRSGKGWKNYPSQKGGFYGLK